MKRFLFWSLLLIADSAHSADPDIGQLIDAAEKGNSEAMYAVFDTIEQKGTPEKPISNEEQKLATYWLIKAGESRNRRAASVLALCYEKGCFGVPVDPSKALYYQGISKSGAP